MATSTFFKGREIIRPGFYSQVKSGIKNPAGALSSGNVCIIDTGIGSDWMSGCGILGERLSGKNSIYSFQGSTDFNNFAKGGYWTVLSEPLFKPWKNYDVKGVRNLFYIKAAETIPAELTLPFTNGPVVLKTLDEGTSANGVVTSSVLTKGYGVVIKTGIIDPAKVYLEFKIGTFSGADAQNNNRPFNNIAINKSEPLLLVKTPEFSTISEFISWMNSSTLFKDRFSIKTTPSTPGAFVSADVTGAPAIYLFAGATESYTSAAFDKAIESISDLDNTFFLSTDYGTEGLTGSTLSVAGNSLNNDKILDFIGNTAKYEKFLWVGGGNDAAEFKGTTVGYSEHLAKYFDSEKVVVVHGGEETMLKGESTSRLYDSLYKTCRLLGRKCGLAPYVPMTLKRVNIYAERHLLSEKEQEFCLKTGIMYTYFDSELESIVCGQGINTLQRNENLVNEDDSSSFAISVEHIKSQLNKEIQYYGKRQFFGNEQGPTRHTMSQEDIQSWLGKFLQDRTASIKGDNLILWSRNIQATYSQDIINITYEFGPNSEISKAIVTGTMLEN